MSYNDWQKDEPGPTVPGPPRVPKDYDRKHKIAGCIIISVIGALLALCCIGVGVLGAVLFL